MDYPVIITRVLCLLLFIFEILYTSTAESLGASGPKFPHKFGVNLPHPDRKQSGRRSRSQDKDHIYGTKSNLDHDSIEKSKILHFIDTIRTNSSVRSIKCNESEDRTITLSDFDYKFDSNSFQHFKKQAENGELLAKSVTELFIYNRNLELRHLTEKPVTALLSVLKVLIEEEEFIAGGGIAFSTNFFPYVYKKEDGSVSKVKDFSSYHDYSGADFYSIPKKNYEKSLSSDVTSGQGNKDASSSVFDSTKKFWGQPYYDCTIPNRWIVAASFPFFGYNQTGNTRAFKGVVLFDFDLNNTSVNQCKDSNTLFSGSHKCRPESTQCRYAPGKGLAPGNYNCHCKPGFYFPVLNATQKYFTGTQLESHFLSAGANFSTQEFQCLPCRQGCQDCEDDSPCLAEYNLLMRGIPLGIQSFCMTITLVLGIVVLRFRKCKVMVIGMWCLLEIIILGALFLYATVVIQYFEPSTTTCLITPWLREVGFAILYGALVLKIYRLLADFQSRKAHRVHVRDKDLLKYLLCIVIVVTGYMAAWTAVSIDQVKDGQSMVDTGTTSEGELRYLVCKSGWWDYSTEVVEVLFLMFGIYLCYKVRAAPSEYSEGTYVSAAICYECFMSTVFYVLRHIYWLNLHPDFLFLMYFLRCQLTVSVTLVLVFGPKLWYAHRPPDDRQIRNRAYSSSDVPDNMAPETMKLNVGISSNGDVDVGEVSLADMDPEDIRAELKRLYTQLQIYKTRSMRKDNPHISKRRGGRKTTHRRFSLQAFHHKHRHHHEHDHEHEMSKTPEESTNSAEGLPMPLEMSVSKCEDLNETKPPTTVSFKVCHTHK